MSFLVGIFLGSAGIWVLFTNSIMKEEFISKKNFSTTGDQRRNLFLTCHKIDEFRILGRRSKEAV